MGRSYVPPRKRLPMATQPLLYVLLKVPHKKFCFFILTYLSIATLGRASHFSYSYEYRVHISFVSQSHDSNASQARVLQLRAVRSQKHGGGDGERGPRTATQRRSLTRKTTTATYHSPGANKDGAVSTAQCDTAYVLDMAQKIARAPGKKKNGFSRQSLRPGKVPARKAQQSSCAVGQAWTRRRKRLTSRCPLLGVCFSTQHDSAHLYRRKSDGRTSPRKACLCLQHFHRRPTLSTCHICFRL